MSKQDYEVIARAIREARSNLDSDSDQHAVDVVTDFLAMALKRENGRFNTTKFYEAAEYKTLNVE